MKTKLALVLSITVAPMLAIGGELPFVITDADTGNALAGATVVLPTPATTPDNATSVVQQDRQFIPQVLAVATGTDITFPNRDNTQHHVYSFSPAKTFEIELYAGVPESPVRFDKSGVVELGCNIHDNMQGFIVVTDQQHGVTGDDGRITLAWPDGQPLPDNVQVWHPRLGDNTRLQDHAIRVPESGEPVAIQLEVRPEPKPDSSLQRLQQRFREL